jgi:GT2 family glycosyltransferase
MSTPVKLITAIPSLGMSPLLLQVASVAARESDEVLVYDNSPVEGESRVLEIPLDSAGANVRRIPMPGVSLYVEWNAAAEYAAEKGAILALLNDDIHLMPGMLTQLAEGLAADSSLGLLSFDWDPTPSVPHIIPARGTYQNGGIAGWGFVVRPGAWPGIDPAYRLWYGDDDMVFKMWQSGWGVGRYRGLYVKHEASTTVNRMPWANEAIAADTQRWRSQHS